MTIGCSTAWAWPRWMSRKVWAAMLLTRDTSMQGRITYHLSPSIRLTARLYSADSFGKVLGEPGIIGSPSGVGIVNAVPLAPSVLKLYENGTPFSQLNTGNATFFPAPDNPDYTRAARFSAAMTLNGQISPVVDYSVSYQLVSNGRRYGDGPAGLGYQPDGSTIVPFTMDAFRPSMRRCTTRWADITYGAPDTNSKMKTTPTIIRTAATRRPSRR